MNSSEIELLQSFFAHRGWRPFPFQVQTWEAMLEGRSGLVHVATGSGKTYAAGLGLFAKILAQTARAGLKGIYITPLRALARDIEGALREPLMQEGWPLKLEARTGDTSYAVKQRQLRHAGDVLLTTPESLALMISQPEAEAILSKVECVVLDEWHELLASKRGTLLELSLSYLRQLNPELQTWALSASIGNLSEAAQAAAGVGVEPVIISGGEERGIDIECLLPDQVDRFPWAGHLGLSMQHQLLAALDPQISTLIFTNTRMQAERWFRLLEDLRPDMRGLMAIHHSSLDRAEREAVEAGVKSGDLKWVVCTSSLDLGVDFQPVERVVQIGSPKMIARMLQRAGRSAHRPGGRSRLLFVPTNSWEILELEAVKEALQRGQIEPRQPLHQPTDVLLQHMTTLACGPGLSIQNLWSALQSTYSYRSLPREDLNWCLDFLKNGGRTLQRYPQYHKLDYDAADGRYHIADPIQARYHRMSIGTIVKRETAAVAYTNRRRIGTIDESFVARLKRGDVFQFAGRTLEFIRLHDMTAYVKASPGTKSVVPSWEGNRFPISETLARAFRETLGAPHPELDRFLAPLLGAQAAMSALPHPDTLLIESLRTREGEHFLAYPFEGRLVHEGLAQLWALRFAAREATSFSFSVNDYGFELLAPEGYPFFELFDDDFFAHDRLTEQIGESLHISQMSQRQFREIAQIAGLVFAGYPGSPKSGRQKQISSGLLYEVFRKYDPENLLLRQSFNEVLFSSLEVERLRKTLQRLALLKRSWQRLTSPSPLAFPLLIEMVAGRASNESLEKKVARLKKIWEKPA
jgi:ATP-dependent Lhr-like helicase